MTMLAEERQAAVLAEIDRAGTITTAALIEKFGVSPITVRRDLTELAAQNLIVKVHGGARSVHATNNPSFATKSTHNLAIKQALAREAAQLVGSGDSIGLVAGTTITQVAAAIAARNLHDLTVITNSIRIADEFPAESAHNLFVTGGRRTATEALVGPLAVASLRNLHFETLFVSAHVVDAVSGATSPSLEEAETIRTMIAGAQKVVLLFDHTKWGASALATFAHWPDIDLVITDAGMPAEAIDQLKTLVEKVVIAK